MNIFSKISHKPSRESLAQVFLAILKAATDKRLVNANNKWSLAELYPDNEDFEFLYRWMGNIDNFLLTDLLESRRFLPIGKYTISPRIGLGIVLLFLDSEIARRFADEGHLWSHCHAHFPGDAKKTFFLSDGQPTQEHKDLVEIAARNLKLRNVFAVAGSQHWLDTIFLQFGFTHKGFMRRLPEWLSGQNLPQAIDRLLNSEEKSLDFLLLWDGLKHHRKNNIDEKVLRQIISKSPWVLKEWENDLISIVHRKMYLLEATSDSGKDSFDLDFLTPPEIKWNPPNEPTFQVQLVNLSYLSLSASSYDLVIGEKKYSKLLKQADGSYSIYPDNEFSIPMNYPSMIASLVDKTGNIEYTMVLKFWDADSDVNIYKLPSGQLVKNPWQEKMNTQYAYILAITPDLKLEPEVPDTVLISKLVRLYLLTSNWLSTTKVMIKEQELWSPEFSRSTKTNTYSPNVSLRIKGNNEVRISTPFFVTIIHSDNEAIIFARTNMQMLAFSSDSPGKTVIGPIIIKPEVASYTPTFYIGMRKDNETKVIVKQLDNLELVGVTQLTNQGWKLALEKSELTIGEAYADQFRFYPPKKIDGELVKLEDYALMEGDIWISSLWSNARSIKGLAGFGASLTIKVGPYNSLKGDILHIASSVINRGIITKVDIIQHTQDDISNAFLKLKLVYSIEPDENHLIIIWDTQGLFFQTTKISSDDNYSSWTIPFPDSVKEVFAVGIAYQGVCIGSWWSENRIYLLDKITNKNPNIAAAMIRWLHMPILNKKYKNALKPFINLSSDAVFGAWFSDFYLPENLFWGEKKESWFDAMRKLFQKWNPNKGQVIKVMKALSNDNNDLSLLEIFEKSFWQLQRVDPVLMAKILKIWINEYLIIEVGKIKAQEIINQYIATLAQLTTYSESQVREKYKSLLQDAAKDMKKEIDTSFLEKGLVNRAVKLFLGEEIENFDKSNLALAISIKPFRDLLSIKLLEQIIK